MDITQASDIFQYRTWTRDELENNFFQEIYEAYRDEMYYAAYAILQNRQDAEDVVHEAFMALLAHMDRLERNCPRRNRNYILTIVKNKAKNLYKSKKRQSEKEVGEEALEDVFDEEPDAKIMEMEKKEFIKEMLKRMNPSYRDILLLQYYHEMDFVEIAEALGKTPDNVRHMSVRAKKKLKEMLVKYGFQGG